MKQIRSFIRFSRPHTIAGTLLSISCLFLIASARSSQYYEQIPALLFTLLCCLGVNIYIVGLNQITDIEIDKINKPWLPLAAGEFSKRTGYVIILISVFIALLIAVYFGKYLLLTVIATLILGTAYSLPPIRLKRYYFWAAFCIIAVRGIIVNLFLYIHFQYLINGDSSIPLSIWVLTASIFVFSIAIAWFKDIPDMEGDEQYKINTLTLRLGAGRVFLIGNLLLGATLVFMCVLPFILNLQVHRTIFVVSHVLMLIIYIVVILSANLKNKISVRRFYLSIWLLFFMEYIAFGLSSLFYFSGN